MKVYGEYWRISGLGNEPERGSRRVSLINPPHLTLLLYIYDPDDAPNYRMANRWNGSLHHVTMQTLQDMLFCHRPGAPNASHVQASLPFLS
jgi:hypothetical protein